jgi:hypothetical protein
MSGIPAASASNFRIDSIVVSSAGVVSRLQGTQSTTTTMANRTGAATIPAGSMLLYDLLIASTGVSAIRDRRPWAAGVNYRYKYTGGNITIPAATPAVLAGLRAFRLECSGNPIKFTYTGRFDTAAVQGAWTSIVPYVDGSPPADLTTNQAATPSGMVLNSGPGAGAYGMGITQIMAPAAGSHLFQFVGVGSHAGTLYANVNQPLIIAIEELNRAQSDNGTA